MYEIVKIIIIFFLNLLQNIHFDFRNLLRNHSIYIHMYKCMVTNTYKQNETIFKEY